MCCEFILSYFRDNEYEEVEDTDEIVSSTDDFEESMKMLFRYEPGLLIHYNYNGNVTFSRLFLYWYKRLPEPLSTFMNEFNIVRATCDIEQLLFMGKLDRSKHYIFLRLLKDNYLN
jgi:hypothetical protein